MENLSSLFAVGSIGSTNNQNRLFMKSTKHIILWQGLYMALVSMVIYAILSVVNPELIVSVWYLVIAAFIVPVVFMVAAARKAAALEVSFPYKRAFVVTLLTGLLGSVLGNVLGNIHTNVVDPEFGYYIKDLQVEKQMARTEKWIDSKEKLDAIRAELEEKTHNPGATQYLMQIVFISIFVAILALIVSIFVKRTPKEQIPE